MESMRDVDRVMEREIVKGSCPLKLERIEIDSDAYQSIPSQEKLQEVLSYLLRVGDYKQYAGRTVNNNVYMDIKGREPVFHRTKSVIERNNIFKTIRRHEKKIQPDYEKKVYLETVKCFFTISEEDMIKYRYTDQGRDTYAFLMSDRYIKGLYLHCLVERKEMETGLNENSISLEDVKKVLFQCLLMDDVQIEENQVYMKMYSVYLL